MINMNNEKNNEKKYGKNNENKSQEEIRKEVTEFYQKITEGEVNTEGDIDLLYKSLGYDEEILKEFPEEIRLGLSCGNPIEKLIVEKGDTILDLGSGAGLDVFIARKKFPEAGTIYGMDRLPSMIEKAERIMSKRGLEGIEFKLGELTNLPFEDSSINKIISNCVINLEPDKKKAYEEIYRVLKPGGMFFISDISLKKPLSQEIWNSDYIYGT